VADKLADRFAKGVFIPGKAIRPGSVLEWKSRSNKPDIEGNERGMSIKLLNVPGEKNP